jgi:predicted CoA-binding protein
MEYNMKKTLVLGATTNPERTAYVAVHRLVNMGHEVIPVGVKTGEIAGITIANGQPKIEAVDTVSLYVNPEIQKSYYDYLLALQPNRIIFNPGTENLEFQKLLSANNIYFEESCTLVLLSLGEY